MKKLMMIAAVAACAVQAQAYNATIDFGTDYADYSVWTVCCWGSGRVVWPYGSATETAPEYGYNVASGATHGEDYTAFLNDGTKSAEQQIAYLNNTVKGSGSDYAFLSYHIKDLANLKTDGTGKISVDWGSQYSWLFVLTSTETATYGTEYAVVRAHEHERTTDEKEAGTGGVDYTNGDVTKPVYTAGNYTISGVWGEGGGLEVTAKGTIALPEPTSGLLLLLGVAGLALKRKQRG